VTGGFGREEIIGLLSELAAELDRQGVHADVFLVGGAALAVAYDARRTTRDLDATFAPTEVVRAAAAVVAERHGLSLDWFNDAVKGFLCGEDPDARRFFSAPGISVDVASPRYLLAMKLFSSRVESDTDDIKFLYRLVGFSTVEEGLNLVEQAYPSRSIQPKVQYLLEEIVASMRSENI